MKFHWNHVGTATGIDRSKYAKPFEDFMQIHQWLSCYSNKCTFFFFLFPSMLRNKTPPEGFFFLLVFLYWLSGIFFFFFLENWFRFNDLISICLRQIICQISSFCINIPPPLSDIFLSEKNIYQVWICLKFKRLGKIDGLRKSQRLVFKKKR